MKRNLYAWIFLIILIPSFLSGCKGILLKGSYGNYYSRLASHGYESEIARLSAMTDEKSPSFRPNAHLYLSLLYSSYNNPNKNYLKALEEMEKYISLVPGASANYEVQNILVLLKEINSVRAESLEEIALKKVSLKSKNQELLAENEKLEKSVESQKLELTEKEEKIVELEKTISQLNETIDKLKNLDMELEKKRKSFR